ncbi:MAG: hypothetical protein ACM3H8_11635 [Sphingobacteriales bacterium]
MKDYKIIPFLLIISVFLLGAVKEKGKVPGINVTEERHIKSYVFNDNNYPGNSNNLTEYEVRITHIGYMILYGSLEDCQIRKDGNVELHGMLSGNENVGPDDPILYTGVLQLSIDMDICSAMRVNGEDKLCSMTVKGSGPVKTELEIDSSAGYGYIKIKYDTALGKFQRSVVGTCDHKQLVEEENMVPNESIASIFNGRELRMLTNRTLRVGRRYVERADDNETVIEVLRVIRK